MYLYENHLHGFYASIDKLSPERLRCSLCGDSDTFIGEANTIEEAKELLKDYELHYGEFYDDYIQELLNGSYCY